MRVFTSPAELEAAVGAELGVSGWFTVGQDRIDAFAEATGDRQWIHVDVERARRESPYRATVAHGYLTLSMLPAFIYDVIRLDGVRRSVNYGSNRGRFPAPVPAAARPAGASPPAPPGGAPRPGCRPARPGPAAPAFPPRRRWRGAACAPPWSPLSSARAPPAPPASPRRSRCIIGDAPHLSQRERSRRRESAVRVRGPVVHGGARSGPLFTSAQQTRPLSRSRLAAPLHLSLRERWPPHRRSAADAPGRSRAASSSGACRSPCAAAPR